MKILLSTWNNIFDDVLPALIKRGHTFVATPEEADVLLMWNEVGLSGRPIIERAHKLGKKAVTLQHGRFGSSRVYPPFNEHIISDKYLCWGEGDRKRLLEIGTDPDKLEVVGSPIIQHLKPRVKHKGKNVIFCPEHWDTETVENLAISTELKKLRGAKVISKLLEGEHDPRFYQNPIVSKRNAPGHLDKVMEVLSTADLVVSLIDGTFELLAEALDIPVVLMDMWTPKIGAGDPRYLEYKRPCSGAVHKVKELKDLNGIIIQDLKHPEHLREERKRVAIEDGGINITNPTDRIISIVESLG